MTGLPNATPAPGSGSGLPAPAAPVAAPEAAPVVAPVATAKPGDVVTAAALPTSPPSPTTPANPTTPAAAPTVEPVTTEPVAEVKPREVFKSGNESFDQVANLLSERGVANYAAILQEAADGSVSLESKASLAETLGGPVADIVLKQLEGEVASQKAAGSAEATRLKDKAAEIFGYPADQADDTWAALQNFAKSTESGLSESDLAVLGEMLEKGGVQGDMAVNDLASRYERSQGFQKVPNLMSGDGQTQSGFEPLDKLNYQTAMREAQQKFGEGSREVDALRARRTASIQRGF